MVGRALVAANPTRRAHADLMVTFVPTGRQTEIAWSYSLEKIEGH